MNRIEALKRIRKLRTVVIAATREIEELRSSVLGEGLLAKHGRITRITFNDGSKKTYLSIASAIRALKARLGQISTRRGTRFDLERLATRLKATVEVSGEEL